MLEDNVPDESAGRSDRGCPTPVGRACTSCSACPRTYPSPISPGRIVAGRANCTPTPPPAVPMTKPSLNSLRRTGCWPTRPGGPPTTPPSAHRAPANPPPPPTPSRSPTDPAPYSGDAPPRTRPIPPLPPAGLTPPAIRHVLDLEDETADLRAQLRQAD